MKCNLKGLRNSIFWKRNMKGFFEIDGKPLTDKQVRYLVEYGIKKGYETESDFTEDELKEILKQ